MNTPHQLTVHDPGRKADFERIFGSATVAIQSPFPVLVSFDDCEELAYFLDMETIDIDCQVRLINHIAAKFGMSLGDVATSILNHGVPIIAEHTTVASDMRGWL